MYFQDYQQKLISDMANMFGVPKEMLTQNYEVDADSMSRRAGQQYEECLKKVRQEFERVASMMYDEWIYNSLPFWSKVVYQIKKAYKEVYKK